MAARYLPVCSEIKIKSYYEIMKSAELDKWKFRTGIVFFDVHVRFFPFDV
jgi:hypothetical protein